MSGAVQLQFNPPPAIMHIAIMDPAGNKTDYTWPCTDSFGWRCDSTGASVSVDHAGTYTVDAQVTDPPSGTGHAAFEVHETKGTCQFFDGPTDPIVIDLTYPEL